MGIAKHMPHARLPKKEALEQEYIAGASYAELAEKYGVKRKTVYNTMKDRARKAGTTWPLKQNRPDLARRRSETLGRRRWDSVTAVMIRLEIIDICKLTGISYEEFSRQSEIPQGTVWDIVSGRRVRTSRATAAKVEAAVRRMEKSHAIREAHRRRREAAA